MSVNAFIQSLQERSMLRFWLAAACAALAVSLNTHARAEAEHVEPAPPELAEKLLPGAGLEESSKGKLVIVAGARCFSTARRVRNGFWMSGMDTSVLQADIGERHWIFYHDGAPLMLRLRGQAPNAHIDCRKERVTAPEAVRAYLLRIGALQKR